jgi:hypothetical protein
MAEESETRTRQLAEAIEFVGEALDAFRAEAVDLTSGAERAYAMYSVAAASRAAELWQGAYQLRADGLPAGIGLLTRTAWEAWLTGTYVLLGQATAVHALANQQLIHDVKVARFNGLEDVPALSERRDELDATERARQVVEAGRSVEDESPIVYDALDIENMARLVQPLLAARGREEDVLSTYHVLYRSHSAWDVHGMAVLDAHLHYDEASDTLSVQPFQRWLDPAASLATVGAHLVLLDCLVLDEFGGDASRVEALYEAATAILAEANPSSTDDGT